MSYASTYANQVKTALENSWLKEVHEWFLCLGVGGNSWPIDVDGNYECYINDAIASTAYYYHGTTETATYFFPNQQNQRKISIGSLIHLSDFGYIYDPEIDLINSAICHEFYHGIEWSLNSTIPYQMLWMIEGQA